MNAGHGEKRSRKREAAIAALLLRPTLKEAARDAGISQATLIRWLRDAGFSADYKRARERTLELASEKLQHGTMAAVAILAEIAANRKTPSASRVQACRSFLEATGLLKGMAASVTVNNNIPQTVEGLDAAIAEQLRAMLKGDSGFRRMVKQIIAEAEENDGKLSIQ